MLYTVYGTHQDTIGIMLAGHFAKNSGQGYPVSPPFSAIGWINGKGIVGQCIFNDYTGADVEIHLYLPGYINRKTITDVYNYVFNILGCVRLTAKPSTRHNKLLEVLERMGFVYEFTQKDHYKVGDELLDAVVYKLTKDTIPKWIKINENPKAACAN